MHARGIVHRDVKPENLVLVRKPNADNKSPVVKLIDFGFARPKLETESLHTPCFTLPYAAPEVLSGAAQGYDEACDLWSLGAVLHGLLARGGRRKIAKPDYLERLRQGDFDLEGQQFGWMTRPGKLALKALLEPDPRDRPTAEQFCR